MFSVRDFAPADQEAVRALIQDGLRSRWGNGFDPTANPDTDDLWQHYVMAGCQIVVVEDGSDLVGTGILAPEQSSPDSPTWTKARSEAGASCRLLRISVSGAQQRRGIGRIVVEELVRRATAQGAAQVVVSTDTPWTDAVALYISCGFVESARDDEETHLTRRL